MGITKLRVGAAAGKKKTLTMTINKYKRMKNVKGGTLHAKHARNLCVCMFNLQ